jgi:MATE family multidrug resistance protein
VRLGVAYMGTCGVLFVVFREPLAHFFVTDGTPPEQRAELVRLAGQMLIAAAAFQLFDAVAMVLTGALRGAGDTFYPGAVTVVASWSVIVGGGLLITRLFPDLKSVGAWIAAALYIFTLCVALLVRFAGGKWMQIRLLKESSTETAASPAALCPSCGTDIAGLAAGQCVECGCISEAITPGKLDR